MLVQWSRANKSCKSTIDSGKTLTENTINPFLVKKHSQQNYCLVTLTCKKFTLHPCSQKCSGIGGKVAWMQISVQLHYWLLIYCYILYVTYMILYPSTQIFFAVMGPNPCHTFH